MELLDALLNLIQSLAQVVWALVRTIVPWVPLIAWVAFWTLAVDWVKLRAFFLKGGWIGLVLLGVMAILVWGVVAPPESGTHSLLGLEVSNFVGKAVYVTAMIVIMMLCGSVQLSGCCDSLVKLETPLDESVGESAAHH